MGKKEGEQDFEVMMGSFDGVEIWKLVDILHTLAEKCGRNDIGLYTDDGVAYFQNISGARAECLREDIIDLFKIELQLNVTSKTNLKVDNFLDVTFNLTIGKCESCNKRNNDFVYIDVNYNHLPNIVQNLPEEYPVDLKNS